MSRSFVSIAALLLSFLIVFQSPASLAQAPRPPNDPNQTGTQLTGTRKQLATIIFSGLAGAILGLSTLSFYGKPQERLDNIAVGAALGIIGGAIYSTYQVARAPYEMYDVHLQPALPVDRSVARLDPKLTFSWEF